jgi:hypothetical protein
MVGKITVQDLLSLQLPTFTLLLTLLDVHKTLHALEQGLVPPRH